MDSILSIIRAILIVVFCIGGCMYGYPKYQVYKSDLAGQAQLKEAESNRKIIILEAEAQKESAALLAEVEVTRAKGVAEANKIIGNSLKNNESYLRWLWISNMKETSNDVIYIPTEAGLPILEAGKREKQE